MTNIKYYSQYGQDAFLDQHIFTKSTHGVFVDIGAHDGVTCSNTYLFEQRRKWKGLCIEPIPHVFEKLKKNRNCLTLNYAISTSSGQENFQVVEGYAEMLSGIQQNYSAKHKKRIQNEIKAFGGVTRNITVECRTVNQLMSENNISHANYCSIDTEGSEWKILKSIDFNQYRIDVFTIEANYKIDRVRFFFFLSQKGYHYLGMFMSDMIFVHKRLGLPIWKLRAEVHKRRQAYKHGK